MDRKFVIALSSLVGSMMLTEAHAVGLGEIKLRTNLNEPLRADIQLMQVKDLSENEILVNLASKEEFAKAGVDRDFLLNSLHFRLDLADPKNPKVVVTTEQPIREPYLNFLLEVQWPSGRLLREYTLLMDLPAFADTAPSGARSVKGTLVPEGVALPRDEGVSEVGKAPAQTSAPVQKPAPAVAASKPAAEVAPEANSAAPAPVSEPEVKQSSKAAASMGVVVRRATKDEIQHYRAAASSSAAAEPAPVASQEPVASKPADEAAAKTAVADGHYGPTQSDDTLWKIAQRVRPSSSISMHQTMVAIQMLNPQAFNKGNINQLKKGQVLKLPSQEEITSIGQAEAVASVNNQVNEWKGQQAQQSPTGGQQLDATGKAAPVAPAAAPSDGQLKLAAPAESNTATASKAAGNSEVAALQSQLSTGMEELSRAQREHQDMSSRAQDLDGQIANAEKLMNLQSGELAALQAKLAAEQQAKADADAKAKAEADAAAAKVAADAAAKVAADAAAQQQAAAVTPPPAAAEPAAVAPQPAAPTTTEQPPVSAASPKAPAPEPVKPIVKQPAAAAAPTAEQPFLNNTVLGGIGGIVALLLALFGYRKMSERREQRAIDEEEALADFDVTAEAPEFAPADVGADIDVDLSHLEQDVEPAQVVEEAVVAAEAPKPESGDVLGEADIYISFGNFDKGETLLKSAIQGEPNRADYRLKLLELYKESDNLSAFDEAYKALIELDDDLANMRAGELRGKISGADSTPFAFGVSSVAAAAGISDDDLDFDLDMDMELDNTVVREVPVVEAAPVAADEGFDLDLDLDFDLETNKADEQVSTPATMTEAPTGKHVAITEAPTARHTAINLDDLAFDLDLDAEPEAAAPVVVTPAEPDVSSDDLDLDFDLDFDTGVDAEPAQEEVLALEDVSAPAAAPVVEAISEFDSAMLEAVTADAGDVDEELDFLSDADEAATKLDLARAYIDMGDKDGARDILEEVLEEGRDEQKREAKALLDSIA